MELPDFLEFEPFNELRRKMGTDQLGNFEFFDPELHLTGEERSQLSRDGLTVHRNKVLLLSDHTLAFKNSRIVVLDQERFHLSDCGELKGDILDIATDARAIGSRKVCDKCLHTLRYKGFDAFKQRKAAYSQQVIEAFVLADFFSEYKVYPIQSQEMTLHVL